MFVDGIGEVQLYDSNYNPVHWQDGVGAERDDGLGSYGAFATLKDANGHWYQLGDDFHVRRTANIPDAQPLLTKTTLVRPTGGGGNLSNDPNVRAAGGTASTLGTFFSQKLSLGSGFSLPYWAIAAAGGGLAVWQRRKRRR